MDRRLCPPAFRRVPARLILRAAGVALAVSAVAAVAWAQQVVPPPPPPPPAPPAASGPGGAEAATPTPSQTQPSVPAPPSRVAVVLQGLDKVTARISTFEVVVDEPVRFGTLEIAVRTCYETPPTEPPESAAFIEISDNKPGELTASVFTGWMFASSPALSALEHPVYDVWVVDCRNALSWSSSSSQ